MELSVEKKKLDVARVNYDENGANRFVKRDTGYEKQLSIIEDVLSKFGLLKNEIRVYLYLARVGTKKASEIAEAISLQRTETYRILRDLEQKRILFSIFENPLKFTAVPLDKAIDLLVDEKKMKIRLLEREKESLIELWGSVPRVDVQKTEKELFQRIDGEQSVILKAQELLEKTERKFEVFVPNEHLAQLYYHEFTDKLRSKMDKIDVMLLAEDSPKTHFFIDQLDWPRQNCGIIEEHNLPCFMVSDEKEVLISFQEEDVKGEAGYKKKVKTAAIWTNYSAFIWTYRSLFSKLKRDNQLTEQTAETPLE